MNARFRLFAVLAVLFLSMATIHADLTVTILHNNDGESQLLNAGSGLEEYGGAARFVTLVNQIKGQSINPIMLSSGDNFLAGPEFAASMNDGVYYDAEVLNAIGYNAIVIGNHDFDFGPDVLADFIGAVDSSIPYLSANLDFSGEANLDALVGTRIFKSVQVNADGLATIIWQHLK